MTPTIEWLEENYTLGDRRELYDFWSAPYFLGVAMALDDPKVREIVLMKAAQIGWTYFILGYLLKRMVEAGQTPCAILLLFAKAQDGKSFRNEKMVPSVKATPLAREVLGSMESKTSGNTWDNTSYDGGFCKIVGSNSPGNVKSSSKIGVVVVEEPDDTTDNVADQGDAITMAEERLKRAENPKMVIGGTPAVKGRSKTEKRLRKTDQRVLPIKCHNCGEFHVLDWDNVHVDKDETRNHEVYGQYLPDSAIYRCPDCGFPWDDFQRKENIRNTCFDAYRAGDENCGWQATAEFNGAVGFQQLSELYACMGDTGLVEIVKSWLEAEASLLLGDETDMRAFQNQKLGKAYEYKTDRASADELREKVKAYDELLVPSEASVLTIGVDIQWDRIAIIIRGWGKGMESWLVYWGEIYANVNINDINDPVWKALDAVLFGSYLHESGAMIRVNAVSIDSSDGTTNATVYEYVRTRQGRGVRVMAIKGATSYDAPVCRLPKKLDMNATNTKANKYGLQIWPVGTQMIKDAIAAHMGLGGRGPHRMHVYEGVRHDYFDQVAGEVKAPAPKGDRLIWQRKSGSSVEAWDGEVYAYHAAHVEKLHIKKPSWWEDKLAQLIQGDLLGSVTSVDDLVTSIDTAPSSDDFESAVEPTDKTTVINVKAPAAKQSSAGTSLADLGRMMNG